jgi:hypothetical protein
MEVKTMLKMLPGKRAADFDEAAIIALHDAGKDEMTLDIARLFTPALDLDRLRAEGEKSINAGVHTKYGHRARWSGRQWFVPVPQPSYDSSPVPHMSFAIQAYLVAAIRVDTPDWSSRSATIVGLLNKREKLVLPISLLQAILDDDLGQFEVASKDGAHTGWTIPGFKEALRLPNDFIAQLSRMLRLKSVAAWLLDFGAAGKAIAPQVVGALIGLQFHDVITPLPVGKQPYRREVVIADLTQMFGSARAAEMFERAAPHLKASMTNNEAVAMIIKEDGRRFLRNGL